MTMTVDSALEKLRECDHYLEEVGVVAAEVERLQFQLAAATASVQVEIERLQKVVADQALTIGTLKDEVSRRPEPDIHEMNVAIIQDRDRELADLQEQLDALGNENDKLREEAQTSRLALDVALKEVERLRAKCERTDQLLSGMPKPGAAT